MVQAGPAGADADGIVRRTQYARFRTDKEATPGYTRELISNRVEAQYYDDLDAQPGGENSKPTLYETFKRNV